MLGFQEFTDETRRDVPMPGRAFLEASPVSGTGGDRS